MKTKITGRHETAVWILLSLAVLVFPGCASDPGFRPTVSGQRYASAASAVSIPSGGAGRLTIVVAYYTQLDRVDAANQLKTRAQALLNGQEVWLQNDEAGLSVNLGRFKSHAEAEKNLARVKSIYPQLQTGSLQFAFIKEIPVPDPQIPADWYLLNNPCAFSLEIGGYYDVPEKDYYDRKADAARAVKVLREEGEKAFLIHGRFESRIYVGCFGPDEVQRGFDANNRPKYLFSPSVERLQKKYPYRFEHGNRVYEIMTENGRKVRKPWRSTMVPLDILMREINF